MHHALTIECSVYPSLVMLGVRNPSSTSCDRQVYNREPRLGSPVECLVPETELRRLLNGTGELLGDVANLTVGEVRVDWQ